jgi:hypothetical protein
VPYNTKPTAKYVHEFAKKQMEYWQPQSAMDELFWGMYMQEGKGRPAVAQQPGADKPDPLLSGYPAQLIDHDTSTVGNPPMLRLASVSETIKERKKIDFVLEPWLNAAFEMAQMEGDVWLQQVRDMRLFGRGFSCITPLPRLWADGEYGDKVSALTEAEDNYSASTNGDKESLREKRDAAYKEVVAYEEDPQNFPLRWQYWDARSTYTPEPPTDRPWSEVVHVRKMKGKDAKEQYKKLPKGIDEEAEATVYHYINYFFYSCCIAAGDAEPEEVVTWKHGLGECPIIVMESMVLPKGKPGLHWKSALYDFRTVFAAIDVLLSDMIQGTRRFVRNQIALFLDPEARHANTDDPHAVGHPEQLIKINPNESYVPMYNTEKVELMPVPQTTQDSWLAINFLDNNAQNMALMPQERGRLPNSQTSAVTYSQMLDESKGRLHPVNRQLSAGAKKAARLLIKSHLRFLEEFPQAKKLYVLSNDYGSIGVGKEIKGYANAVMPRFSDMTDVNRLQNARLAQIYMGLGVDPETVYSELLGAENGRVWMERSQKYRLQEAVFQGTLAQVQALMQQLMSKMSASSADTMANQLAELPPEVMEILMEEGMLAPLNMPAPQPVAPPQQMMGGGQGLPPLGPGTTPDTLGAASQALANIGGTGTPQMMSELYQ